MTYSTVMITGGAGMVGSHIADLLSDTEVKKIIVYDNFSTGFRKNLSYAEKSGKLFIVDGDIRDSNSFSHACTGVDCIFHEAAINFIPCAENPRDCLDICYTGTFNVFDAAVKAGVKKIVFASSAMVYGDAAEIPTTESCPLNPKTLYASAKIAGEMMLKAFHEMYGIHYAALRYFNIYGPRMKTHGSHREVIAAWTELLTQGKPVKIFGDGTQTADFIYVKDVAEANLCAMNANTPAISLNVGTGTETSLNELAVLMEQCYLQNTCAEHLPARSINHVSRRVANPQKAADTIGFTAKTSLSKGISLLKEWYEASC